MMQWRQLSKFLRNSIKRIEKLDSRVVDWQGVRVTIGVACGLLSCSMKGVVKEKASPEQSFLRSQLASDPERLEVGDQVISSLHAIVFFASRAG